MFFFLFCSLKGFVGGSEEGVHSIAIQERKPGGHDHGNPGKGYGMIGIQ
jgi:hypothetical protein